MSAATHKRPVIIGVTGGSGSGKTSVSRAIFDSLNGHSLLMIQEDSYYKNQDDISFDERVKVNYDHPNAFDTDLLIEQLGDLLEWKAIDIPVYDYVQHTRSIKRDLEERGRSLQSVIDQYLSTVKPMYHQFIEPTKRYADIIVPEGGENQVAIDILVTKVRDIISKTNVND